MCKRILIIAAIVFAVSGLALANTADITQDGTGNEATINQTGSGQSATINQYGTNLAQIDQSGGNNNTATINQGAPGKPVTNFHKPAYASDWIIGSWIEQVGSDNIASTTVAFDGSASGSGNSNSTRIYQNGVENTATQVIGSYSSYTNSNKPYKAIEIDQVGNENTASQTTTSSFGCYGIQNMVTLQTGNSNYAQQDSVGGMASTMEIFQTGNGNSSTQYQWARYSTAHVDIQGNNNITDQYQKYTVWSLSGVDDAYIDIIGDDNIATQSQIGEYNDADIDITGSGNQAYQTQTGDSNYAKINVLGNNNYASQTQTGNGHSSTISQTGDGNSATVVQGP
ncbi:MAG: hypothetical protein OEW82_05875 [Dehalococcoidia bacterium]|nr:hypothetical protein [Dehalococcoidia bacterium]